MLFRKLILAMAGMALVTGCSVDPQQAAERRANLMTQVFPNPADQQGIYLTFPLESGGAYRSLEVIWFSNQVSRATVTQRVAGFCERQTGTRKVGIAKEGGNSKRSGKSGREELVTKVFFRCLF